MMLGIYYLWMPDDVERGNPYREVVSCIIENEDNLNR